RARNTKDHEENSRKYLDHLRAHYNQSEDGSHTQQQMTGCVVGSDRRFLRGYFQSAYDGAETFAVKVDRCSSTPTWAQAAAAPTTAGSNLVQDPAAEYWRAYLKDTCVPWLRLYLKKGKEML
ncbi:patr class I histocompatibility antigen, A-2 alpha chain-like, partial [Sturnira hondurensis]|uniref:patr class I histocompatibility antigen, A-2 alpha chain-like n=1 Tax=Sturnira hondurensis TaxID=192404 RepID=UPI00187A9903